MLFPVLFGEHVYVNGVCCPADIPLPEYVMQQVGDALKQETQSLEDDFYYSHPNILAQVTTFV